MKKLFSFVCVAMLAVAASAQVTWNVKGGLGIATCYGTDFSNDAVSIKSHLVGKIGAGLEYPLTSNLSLMPSFEIAWKGLKVEETWNNNTYTGTIDFVYLQIPVVAAYRMNLDEAWNLTLKAGPYFAYDIYDHFKWDDGVSGKADIKKFDMGLDVGIDFEHHRFVFGVEAEMGFMKLDEFDKAKNLAFYATVGYKF